MVTRRNAASTMLFIIGLVLLLLIGLAVATWRRGRADVNATNLGWMSEQWLAEHRASHAL